MRRLLVLALAASALVALRPADAPAAAPTGLPAGVPPAAVRPEPALPAPPGWPFGEAFPRTSGTGRLADGAVFWADFLYDDHGASGGVPKASIAGLAPSAGTAQYPEGPASMNGADVFRAAVGLDATTTWWRVDWNTLVDPAVPVATWTWKGHALVVTATGATLDGRKVAATQVDREARSFVARIPRTALPVSGAWDVVLTTGLADGTPFDLGFNATEDESGYWMEEAQAGVLASGETGAHALRVDWVALGKRATTPEPRPTGWSNRWYVSSIEPGQGVVRDQSGTGDLQPNFLGRVQPYGVYVPTSYRPGTRTPLTWVLHSLSVQHNQYAEMNPSFLQSICERRGSICATTLGRGPDGWYHDEAELDFWEVWGRLASAFTLDPDRTIISGYSMGGYGTYKLGLEHPDLFAKAIPVAGPPICGVRIVEPLDAPSQGSRACTDEGDTGPLVQNGRDLPFAITHGAADELVPLSSVEEQVGRFDALGHRYRYDLLFTEDHLAYAAGDRFASVAAQYGSPTRAPNPARVTYRFWTGHQRHDLGTGPTGVWWVQDLRPRRSLPGDQAGVDATSRALRPHEDAWTVVRSQAPLLTPDAQPGLTRSLDWKPRGLTSFSRRARIALAAENVSAARVDVTGAGFRTGEAGAIDVRTEGPLKLTVSGATPGMVVRVDGRELAVVGRDGGAVVTVAAGSSQVTLTAR